MWVKARGSANTHKLTDAVRGVTKGLIANTSPVESTDSTGLTAFGADGFTVGTDGNYSDQTGDGMVAWCWKANGSGSANEAGSINTTATSANTANGFSISTYTGNGVAGATVGHGLSQAPNLVIVRSRAPSAADWQVGSIQPAASMDFTDKLRLNANDGLTDAATNWNNTAPTATVVSLGNVADNNTNTSTYVMYCWHSVEGYSKIGVYRGGGTATAGAFIYTGFKPAFVMIKSTNRNPSNWNMYDNARSPYNQVNERLLANEATAESTNLGIDIVSNGFTPKTIDGQTNTGDGVYMYMAFAETPFKHANAR